MEDQNNDWYETTIGQLGQVITGTTPPTKNPEFYGSEYPFITPTDIDLDSRTAQTARFLSEEGRRKFEKRMLPTGAVCFVCIGATIGKTCMTTRLSLTNQQINSVVVDETRHDSRFVFYLLRHEPDRIKGLAGGAATPIVNKSTFSQVTMRVPPLPTQRKIAAILSAYDDLIENNTRRIAILEEMARLLYREWFVHYRFPGHEQVTMVDSELGPVPEGWEVKKLADFGKVVIGKTPSKKVPEYYGDYMPFIKTPSMHGNMFCIEVTDYLSELGAASQQNKTLPPNTLIVNCIGALAGSVSITSVHSQANQQINAIVLKEQGTREFLYFALVDLRETIRQHGSIGATMINLSKGKFEALEVICPGRETLSAYNKTVYPHFELIKDLQMKNLSLRRTRDLLLPRLISGEVDVSDMDL